jgi:hypothetical protein
MILDRGLSQAGPWRIYHSRRLAYCKKFWTHANYRSIYLVELGVLVWNISLEHMKSARDVSNGP